jgi:hypothetical protein
MDRIKCLLATLPPLDIPRQGGKKLTTFSLFPRLAPEIRDMIWMYTAIEPRWVALKYFKCRTGNFLKKTVPKIPGQTRQPAVLHVCQESRIIGKKYHELMHERGQECRSDCPRCRYEASDSASMWGYTKESKHAPLQQEDRNALWVNFERDVFHLSYGKDVDLVSLSHGFYRRYWPGPSDFVFEECDLARIQKLSYWVVPKKFREPSLWWVFTPGTALKGLKTVYFELLEEKNSNRAGERRESMEDELLRKDEGMEFARRLSLVRAVWSRISGLEKNTNPDLRFRWTAWPKWY